MCRETAHAERREYRWRVLNMVTTLSVRWNPFIHLMPLLFPIGCFWPGADLVSTVVAGFLRFLP